MERDGVFEWSSYDQCRTQVIYFQLTGVPLGCLGMGDLGHIKAPALGRDIDPSGRGSARPL